jgi:UDP-N-acetylmuramyl pentapeptide phosphotransferase/UDP-N-acetylglucosamine-1-phosphate transferase
MHAREDGAIAARLECPVALKICSPDVPHKTDVGGVVLDLQGSDATAAAALAMAAVALADDARDFRFVVKLAAQAGAAVVAVASGLVLERLAVPVLGEVQLGWFGVGLTLFWILGCTNAVNFMDGSDALVASVMLVASLALALISASEGAWFVYAASLFLAAVTIRELGRGVELIRHRGHQPQEERLEQ